MEFAKATELGEDKKCGRRWRCHGDNNSSGSLPLHDVGDGSIGAELVVHVGILWGLNAKRGESKAEVMFSGPEKPVLCLESMNYVLIDVVLCATKQAG